MLDDVAVRADLIPIGRLFISEKILFKRIKFRGEELPRSPFSNELCIAAVDQYNNFNFIHWSAPAELVNSASNAYAFDFI